MAQLNRAGLFRDQERYGRETRRRAQPTAVRCDAVVAEIRGKSRLEFLVQRVCPSRPKVERDFRARWVWTRLCRKILVRTFGDLPSSSELQRMRSTGQAFHPIHLQLALPVGNARQHLRPIASSAAIHL